LASLEDFFASTLINIDGSQVAEGFVISLVVVPENDFLKGFPQQLVGVLVRNQVEPLLGGTVPAIES